MFKVEDEVKQVQEKVEFLFKIFILVNSNIYKFDISIL